MNFELSLLVVVIRGREGGDKPVMKYVTAVGLFKWD